VEGVSHTVGDQTHLYATPTDLNRNDAPDYQFGGAPPSGIGILSDSVSPTIGGGYLSSLNA